MIRLNIITEGQTEEYFVKKVLTPHLAKFNVFPVARNVLTSKDRHKFYRGGLVGYSKAKYDIRSWLKEDNGDNVRFTTMFDLYALPDDFPEFNKSKCINDPYKRVEFLENAFSKDINDNRFIPYLQLHEFEALIFVNPKELKIEYFDRENEISQLIAIAEQKGNPELINDNPETAPSKRILKLIPEYDKANVGPDIVELIGIKKIKEHCKHFNDWITVLEKLND